jgi:hypothetical protein
LPNDGLESSDTNFTMHGNGHGNRRCIGLFLHDNMAASLADRYKSVAPKDPAQFLA